MSDREDPSRRRLPATCTLASQISMEAPVCLIETSPEGTLVVRPEAQQVLEGITQPVVVVAIAGLYRTGKSYLMNRLAGKNKGFSLGSTIQAHTKGIWMWCLPHPRRPNQTLVLLDTEGLGDVEKDNTKKDAWIFSLAVLLSSTLVYNSMRTIDGDALEKLHYVTELTKHIKVKAAEAGGGRTEREDAAKFVQFFPDFIWAVRDVTLQLELKGHPITEDEYLDWALSQGSASNKKATKAKKCIQNFFPSRKCFTFGWPASENDLGRLEELQEDELTPKFQATARGFCDHVWEKARPMTILGGHQVTGTVLGNLARIYVASINSGAVPCIENAVQALAQIENAAAVKEALARYTELMGQRAKLPTETLQELLDLHAQCEGAALAVFTGRAFRDDEATFQSQLMGELAARKEGFCRQNEETSRVQCRDALEEASRELHGKIHNGSYLVLEGDQHFLADQKKMVEKYWRVPGKGIKADEVLQEFLKQMKRIEEMTKQCNERLKEKELAAKKALDKADELQKELETKKPSTAAERQEKERKIKHQREKAAKLRQDSEGNKKKYAKKITAQWDTIRLIGVGATCIGISILAAPYIAPLMNVNNMTILAAALSKMKPM